MAHCGYIVKIENLRKHSNADRLQIATIFGNNVIVDLSVAIGDIGVFFPTELQLSKEFCKRNDLVRRKDENGNACGGYLDPEKRNIRTMTLRGEKSEGLYLPISSLGYTQGKFKIGDTIDIINGHEICCKYIPKQFNKNIVIVKKGNKIQKHITPIAPLFMEHVDTEQLAYNLDAFRPGDLIEITLKMHGTSQRTGYLPVLKGYKRSIIDRIFHKEGEPIYKYDYVSGTRRTVLENYKGGFYGNNEFRKEFENRLRNRLHRNEEIFYEVVGYTNNNQPIMASAQIPKEYQKQYGKNMEFSYGCANGTAEMYVYRMTMTNENGDVVEYSPDFMRFRCEQMGINCVPVMWRGFIPDDVANAGEWIKNIAEQYYDGPDPIGKTHVREGVVVRILNRPRFCAYKHKNFLFKLVSGIAIEKIENVENIDKDILEEM